MIGQRSYGVGGHPPLKAGHRGLFAESLTVGTVGTPDPNLGDPIATASAWVDGRVLVPNERVVYHMRNRVYDPGPSGATAGRFLQRDPNASGAVLYGGGGGLGSHGAAPVAVVTGLDLAGHVGDGVNTYGYLRGRMRGAGDPDGLFAVSDIAEAATGVIVQGLRGGLDFVTATYSAQLSADIDWAMDWSLPDDGHTRTSNEWVQESFNEGVSGGIYNALDEATYGLLGAIGTGQPAGPALAWTAPNSAFPKSILKSSKGAKGQWHHIATRYGKHGKTLHKLFRKADLHLKDSANALFLPDHKGSHPESYHIEVIRRLNDVVKAFPNKGQRQQLQVAFLAELASIRADILSGKLEYKRKKR